MKNLLRVLGGPALVLTVLLGSLWVLHSELRQYQLSDFVEGFSRIPSGRLALAVVLTIVNYLILMGYDILGVTYLGHSLRLEKVALGSFLGYAVGNNFGTVLGGSTVRYRLYSSWGLSAIDIVKLILVLGVTFWIGLFGLAGVMFVWQPLTLPPELHLPVADTRPLGLLLLGLASAYLLLCGLRRRPIQWGNWQFSPPPLTLSVLQYLVATLDLMVAALVLYVLLPTELETGYLHFLGVYLLAIVAAMITQVPGGLGILELVIVLFLKPTEPHILMGSLLAYRAIYYLFPLVLGVVAMGAHELSLHSRMAQRAIDELGGVIAVFGPRIMAGSIFGAGTVLLLSGATPAKGLRMERLQEYLPLFVVETAHFTCAILGTMLLVLSRALQRRIEQAYYLTLMLLAGGIALVLTKGLDYEEAAALIILWLVLLPARAAFYRQGVLIADRFTPQWFVSVVFVMVATVWLTVFAYKRLDYRPEMWWEFGYLAHVSRSLRALAGACGVLGVVVLFRLLRVPRRLPGRPTKSDLAEVRRIVAHSPRALSHLALLGDKRFLFSPQRDAFMMFGAERNTYVAMGDPVGEPRAATDLAWDFVEICTAAGRWPVVYQVDESALPLYVELGLSPIRIGDEARVPLMSFDLKGGLRKGLRRTDRNLTAAGYSVRVVEPPHVQALLPKLAAINDDWLSATGTREKTFALGCFQPDYLASAPVAVVEFQHEIVAYANLWLAARKEELSVEMVRALPAAPPDLMDWISIRCALWGRDHGFRALSLGLAPPAGLEAPVRDPLWNVWAAVAYRHAEHFPNLIALRQAKGRLSPIWRPKYLAAPTGLGLPVVLQNVAKLISGQRTNSTETRAR